MGQLSPSRERGTSGEAPAPPSEDTQLAPDVVFPHRVNLTFLESPWRSARGYQPLLRKMEMDIVDYHFPGGFHDDPADWLREQLKWAFLLIRDHLEAFLSRILKG
ncbi:unnamed protein product [Darwinula stevensoni]|uniref:Uncharacterized protein n=1 Tax=Darwinula stevensoni TaxID=69355 RepID=A0A7R9FR24_9CRUS|nr:unnamed protein product [Darwinula stevensoni]CAG0900486.1 unnamed protein product [Darwinula stevensoni]